MENLTGKQLGPYQVVAPLGEGGMAAVYRAYQPSVDRYVALKVLPRYLASDPEFVGRFGQEAKVLAKLLHPHILPVHDYGEADGYTYIVMPFVEGGTLANLLQGEPLPLAQIQRVIIQVGGALDYAHSRGIVHRDVKPSNILIDPSGNCLLTDFGIAKMVEGTIHFTRTGGIVGTPAYMAPEQIQGEGLDGRSDIYSLGIVLYEMVTGRPPYRAETPPAIFVKHLHDPLPPPRTLNPALPEAVERVILKALAKKREDRFSTAGEMVSALQAAMGAAAIPRDTTTQAPGMEQADTAIIHRGRPATAAESHAAPPAVPVKAPRSRQMWILAGGGVVVMIAVIGLVILGILVTVVLKGRTTAQATATLAQAAPTSSATATPAEISAPAEATPERASSMTGVAQNNPTTLFRGPGREYGQVGVLARGTKVALLGRNDQGDWLEIRSEKGTQGWVRADQIEANMPILDLPLAVAPTLSPTRPGAPATPVPAPATEARPSATGVILASTANLYTGPGTDYAVAGAIGKGTPVTLLGRNDAGSWLKVRSERGTIGWVRANQVEAHVRILDLPVAAGLETPAPAAVAFEDDFNSNARGWREGETSDEYGDLTVDVTDGKYRVSFASKQDVIHREWAPDFSAQDFLLSVEATIVQASGGAEVSLVFRENQNGDYYIVEFANDGTYNMWLWNNSAWTRLHEQTFSDAIRLEPGVLNTFAILAEGSSFTIYANGQELSTITDSSLSEAGKIALAIGLEEANQTLTVEFDNLIIKEVSY